MFLICLIAFAVSCFCSHKSSKDGPQSGKYLRSRRNGVQSNCEQFVFITLENIYIYIIYIENIYIYYIYSYLYILKNSKCFYSSFM